MPIVLGRAILPHRLMTGHTLVPLNIPTCTSILGTHMNILQGSHQDLGGTIDSSFLFYIFFLTFNHAMKISALELKTHLSSLSLPNNHPLLSQNSLKKWLLSLSPLCKFCHFSQLSSCLLQLHPSCLPHCNTGFFFHDPTDHTQGMVRGTSPCAKHFHFQMPPLGFLSSPTAFLC